MTRALLCLAMLSAAAHAEEWTDVFDGATLKGWVDEGGRYDGRARWSVEDGAIVGRQAENGAGGLLYTKQQYQNFEVELLCKIEYPFDSGVFVRMVPDKRGAQVTLDHRPGGEIGGIYSDGWYWHAPQGAKHFDKEWNHVRVRCVGHPMHLTAWINGKLVTDYRMPEGPSGFARQGRIGVQVHGARKAVGGAARFKAIRVRRLLEEEGIYFSDGPRVTVTERGKAQGWSEVAWLPADGFRVENGAITALVKGKAPHIVSKDDYGHFHLRMDFKISRMANSGLFLRATRDGKNPAYSGCEIQILDDFNWETVTKSKLKKFQFTGSLYGAVAPKHKAMKPLGEWNRYEVHYLGSRIQTVLNGRILYDVDTHTLDVKPPFRARASAGFIGLQRHAPKGVTGDAYAWFRNVFVRPYDPR